MKSIHRAFGLSVTLLAFGLLAGCGRAPEAAAPSSESEAAPAAAPAAGLPGLAAEPEPEPQTLAEAEALLERSRAQLDRLALNGPPPLGTVSGGSVPGAAAPSQAPAPAPPETSSAPKRAEKSAAEDVSESAREKDASSCETACKAFSSLGRASDAVCRLETDGGQRCERARRIREDARVRVASCGCTK